MEYDLSGVEVRGRELVDLVVALSASSLPANLILQKEKIGTLENNRYQVFPEKWYPSTDKVRLLKIVLQKTGPRMLRKVGEKVLEYAVFPPDIDNIYKAMSSINVAYHMNHRKAGRIMYDASTGRITPGIGNYGYELVANERKIISVCATPNVSQYDEGILVAMARRFQPTAQITLDPSQPTRRKGGDSCTFVITW